MPCRARPPSAVGLEANTSILQVREPRHRDHSTCSLGFAHARSPPSTPTAFSEGAQRQMGTRGTERTKG